MLPGRPDPHVDHETPPRPVPPRRLCGLVFVTTDSHPETWSRTEEGSNTFHDSRRGRGTESKEGLQFYPYDCYPHDGVSRQFY